MSIFYFKEKKMTIFVLMLAFVSPSEIMKLWSLTVFPFLL